VNRSEKIEIIGVAALLVGLVFVGLELRQNSDLLRITATQTLAAEYGNALEVMAYEGEAACVYALGVNGLHNLNDVQRLRLFLQMFLIFRSAEQLHYYSIEGMVEDRVWCGFEHQLTEVANLPGVRERWKARSFWFSDLFQEYIDGVIASGPTVEPQNHMGSRAFKKTTTEGAVCSYRQIAYRMFRIHDLHMAALREDPGCPGKNVNRWMRDFASAPHSTFI
jgi:hypothetical protein